MRKKKRGHWKIINIVIALPILGMAAFVLLNLPKPLETNDSAYDLSRLSDGTYTGNCDNGIVQVQVDVDVQNHIISDVRITHHQNGLGSTAEIIADDIVRHQSVEVDAVSGATMSSKTILKAVEKALSGSGE